MNLWHWAQRWAKDNPDKIILGFLALGLWSRARVLYSATPKPTFAVLALSLGACLVIALAEIWRGARERRLVSLRLSRQNARLQARARELAILRNSPKPSKRMPIEKYQGPKLTHAGMLWEQYCDYDTVEKTYEISTHGPLCSKCKTELNQHAQRVMVCPKEECNTRYVLKAGIYEIKSAVLKIIDSNWRNGPAWDLIE